MPYCIVSNCRNCTKPKRKSEEQIEQEKCRKISYHKFPKDPCKRKIWLTALEINWEPPKTATVCFHHFTENDFEKSTRKRILKEAAIPVIAESINVVTMSSPHTTHKNRFFNIHYGQQTTQLFNEKKNASSI